MGNNSCRDCKCRKWEKECDVDKHKCVCFYRRRVFSREDLPEKFKKMRGAWVNKERKEEIYYGMSWVIWRVEVANPRSCRAAQDKHVCICKKNSGLCRAKHLKPLLCL